MTTAFVALLCALAWLAPHEAAADDDPCASIVRDDPSGYAGYNCYYSWARREAQYDAAIATIRGLTKANPNVPWVWMTLGNLLDDQALPGASAAHERGLSLLAENAEADEEVLARINHANGLRHRGHIDEALAQLDAAAKRADEHPMLGPIVTLERARFLVFTGGDHGQATTLLESVRPALFPKGPYQARVVWLNTAEVLYRRLGRVEQALAAVDELVEIARAEGDGFVEASARLNAAHVYTEVMSMQARPDVQGYRERLERAAEAGRAASNDRATRSSLCLLADLEGPEQLSLARACADRLDTFEDTNLRAVYANLTAIALEAAGAPAQEVREALARSDAAAQAAEHTSAVLEASLARLQLELRAGAFERALSLAERCVLDFRDVLSNTSSFIAAAESSGLWRPQFNHVTHLVARPEATQEELARVLRLHDATLGAAWDSVMETEPEPLRFDEPPAAWLARMQSGLGKHDAVLVYTLDESDSPFASAPNGGSRVWLLTSTQLRTVPLPARHRVAAAARAWRSSLETSQAAPQQEATLAATLGDMLLGPVLEALPQTGSLIVVADAEIHELPVAALIVDGERAASRWTVDRTPSLRASSRWRSRPVSAQRRPVHVYAAPSNTAREHAPLPWAQREAQTIAALYGEATLVREGADASEAHLRAMAGTRGLLHVAAHASVSGGAPLRSAIHLAADEEHDGDLTVAELHAQRFDDEVVVLSACDTSAGVVLPGEGLAGLAQGFFARGAQAVVATLWPVRDGHAQVFMVDFYTALASGSSIADAMTTARRQAIAAGRPSHAWAGFVLLGDGRARVPSEHPVSPPAAASTPLHPPAHDPRWIALATALALGLALSLRWLSAR